MVRACAQAGTDYVDLCGEPAWMHEMIAAYGESAKASGARIVFSCGFDSIPFDLGVFFLQQAAQEKIGGVASRVKGRVRFDARHVLRRDTCQLQGHDGGGG